MKNKRLFLATVMLIFLSLALSVNAGAGRSIGNWLDDRFSYAGRAWFDRDIDTGLANIPFYDDYAQFIDFAIFLILFTSICVIALKKGFGGGEETKSQNAVKALALILGLAMTLAALKAGLSVTFFIPFVANTLFFIVIIIVFFILLRMGMDKHKILAFILAIIITYLLFNFFGAAIDKGRFGVDFNLGSIGAGGVSSGLFGEDCDEIQKKLQKANIELESLKDLINNRKDTWGIELEEDEELSPIKLFERYTVLESELTEDVKSRKQLELDEVKQRIAQIEAILNELKTGGPEPEPISAEEIRLGRTILELENELNNLRRKESRLQNEVTKEGIETTRESIDTYRKRWEKLEKNIAGLEKKKAKCVEKGNWEEEIEPEEVESVEIGDERCKEHDEKTEGTWVCTTETEEKECVEGLCVGKYKDAKCCKAAEGVVVPAEEELVEGYEIVDVSDVASAEDNKYKGTVKYKNKATEEETSISLMFNEDGSLTDSSRNEFATSVNLEPESAEFKKLEQDIMIAVDSGIDALKDMDATKPKEEVEGYEIVDVMNVLFMEERGNYMGMVAYKNKATEEETGISLMFNEEGSLTDSSRNEFANRLNLEPESAEFKKLEQDIMIAAKSRIDALKDIIDAAKLEEVEPFWDSTTGKVTKFGGPGLIVAIIAILVIMTMRKRKAKKSPEKKAEKVSDMFEERNKKIARLSELMEKKDTSTSNMKGQIGGLG